MGKLFSTIPTDLAIKDNSEITSGTALVSSNSTKYKFTRASGPPMNSLDREKSEILQSLTKEKAKWVNHLWADGSATAAHSEATDLKDRAPYTCKEDKNSWAGLYAEVLAVQVLSTSRYKLI